MGGNSLISINSQQSSHNIQSIWPSDEIVKCKASVPYSCARQPSAVAEYGTVLLQNRHETAKGVRVWFDCFDWKVISQITTKREEDITSFRSAIPTSKKFVSNENVQIICGALRLFYIVSSCTPNLGLGSARPGRVQVEGRVLERRICYLQSTHSAGAFSTTLTQVSGRR